jgi:hypothetical protein
MSICNQAIIRVKVKPMLLYHYHIIICEYVKMRHVLSFR